MQSPPNDQATPIPPFNDLEGCQDNIQAIFSWFDRNRRMLLGVVVMLYLVSFNSFWHIGNDSALYVELARNIAEGQGFTYHGQPHRWVEPGLPYLLATTFSVGGVETFWPANLTILAIGLATIGLTYAVMLQVTSRPVAVVVTVATAISITLFKYAFQLLTEVPFVCGVMLFMMGYEWFAIRSGPSRKRSVAGVILIIAGCWSMILMRPVFLTFAGAAVMACVIEFVRGRSRWQHLVVAIIVVGTLFAFRSVDPRRGDGMAAQRDEKIKTVFVDKLDSLIHRVITANIPEMFNEATPEAVFGMELGPGVSIFGTILVVTACLTMLITRRTLWAVWVAATIVQLVIMSPAARYWVPILPFVMYACVRGLTVLNRRFPEPYAGWAVAAGLILLIGPNFGKTVGLIAEQRSPAYYDTLESGTYPPLMQLAEVINESVSDDDIVISQYGRILSYFSRRRVITPPKGDVPVTVWSRHCKQLREARHIYVTLPGYTLLSRYTDTLHLTVNETADYETNTWRLHRVTMDASIDCDAPNAFGED